MKNAQKLIIGLILFAITAVGITIWYISDHILTEFNVHSVLKVLAQVGSIAGIIVALIFLLVVCCLQKIKNPYLITLVMSLIFMLFVFISYWFILHMIFYEMNDKQSFISQLFGA
jgi:uncharacterized protein with PQ loop repeat